MKANFKVITHPFYENDKFILVDNWHQSNFVVNIPCPNCVNFKGKTSIGVWRIKSNG